MYSIDIKFERDRISIRKYLDLIIELVPLDPTAILLGNEKIKELNQVNENINLVDTDVNNNLYSDLIIEFGDIYSFNSTIRENTIKTLSTTIPYSRNIIEILVHICGCYSPSLLTFENAMQVFNIRLVLNIRKDMNDFFSPYWIQLLNEDLFEKINTITPVKKLFENENGVVMQLTEEPTNAENPEHLEKVIKIYEGLFPDYKADRTKLNEIKKSRNLSLWKKITNYKVKK